MGLPNSAVVFRKLFHCSATAFGFCPKPDKLPLQIHDLRPEVGDMLFDPSTAQGTGKRQAPGRAEQVLFDCKSLGRTPLPGISFHRSRRAGVQRCDHARRSFLAVEAHLRG
jgi:hypothetical protein